MSQAIIDFCESLKTTLLGLEERLEKAQAALSSSAAHANEDAQKHLDAAAEQLQKFKLQAGMMAKAVRADLPAQTGAVKEKLAEFGLEAQVAMRHAAVFLAETAAKGATGAAGALQTGAKHAQGLAEKLRHDTALVPTPDAEPPPASA